MTKDKINYNNTVMYGIASKYFDNDLLYIGSSTDFTQRSYEHKCYCNKVGHKCYNYLLYQKIRENGGWENFKVYKIEDYPCSNAKEKAARERYWYDLFKSEHTMLNTKVPNRTKKEYYQDIKCSKHLLFNKMN
jgi:hypothetical protein